MKRKLPSPRAFRSERSLDELLRLWPTVAYRASTRIHRAFAEKIMHQKARPDWAPGPAQLSLMRDLVDIYVPDDIALDPDLVPDMCARVGWNL